MFVGSKIFEEGTLGDFELRKGGRFEAQLHLGFQASFGLPGSLAPPPSACFCATGHFDRDPIGPCPLGAQIKFHHCYIPYLP